jgi:hypothetical protein
MSAFAYGPSYEFNLPTIHVGVASDASEHQESNYTLLTKQTNSAMDASRAGQPLRFHSTKGEILKYFATCPELFTDSQFGKTFLISRSS